MFDVTQLAIFLTAATALIIMPGPAVLYIVARSVEHGRLMGLVSVLGIAVGGLFHVAAATLGLSAILMTSALAFGIVKFIGAIYLIYLGIQTLFFSKKEEQETHTTPHEGSLWKVFSQGVVVSVFNPKTALFFLAFLPQFIDANRGSATLQAFLLGAMFIGIALVSDSIYAVAAGSLGDWMKRHPAIADAQRALSGGITILLGVTTALTGSGNN